MGVSCEATKRRIPCVYLRRTTASLSLCRAVDRRGVDSILVVRRRPLCAWREERARLETRRQSQRGRWKRLWEPPDSCLTAEEALDEFVLSWLFGRDANTTVKR